MTGRLGLGAVGLSLNVAADGSHLDEAAEAERLGYGAIWLPGGQLDRLDRISEIVAATTAIRVVPGIISADVFPAAEVADLYADLQASAPDRFVVGLGGSQQPRSMAALHAYLDELDAAEPAVPSDRRILAALGPRKLELARDRCAGAVTLLVNTAHTATARRILGEHAVLVADQMLVLDTDAERARATARGPLGFLSGVRGYADNFLRMGFPEPEIAELSDRLVDDVVAWGDPAAIAARVGDHFRAGADHVVLGVGNAEGQPGPIEVARQLADLLPTA